MPMTVDLSSVASVDVKAREALSFGQQEHAWRGWPHWAELESQDNFVIGKGLHGNWHIARVGAID